MSDLSIRADPELSPEEQESEEWTAGKQAAERAAEADQ